MKSLGIIMSLVILMLRNWISSDSLEGNYIKPQNDRLLIPVQKIAVLMHDISVTTTPVDI